MSDDDILRSMMLTYRTNTLFSSKLHAEHQAIDAVVTILRQFSTLGDNASVRYGEGHSGLGYYVWYDVVSNITLFAIGWRFLGTSREIVAIAKCIVAHERAAGLR